MYFLPDTANTNVSLCSALNNIIWLTISLNFLLSFNKGLQKSIKFDGQGRRKVLNLFLGEISTKSLFYGKIL